MKKPPKPSHDHAIAYHEAGHAVLAHFLQVRTVEVSIVADGSGRDGYTRHHASQMRALDATARAIISLGGMAAQKLYCPRFSDDRGGEDDERDAYDAVGHLARTRRETRVLLNCLGECARALLSKPRLWRAVKAVAEALLAKKTLTGKEVDGIIRKASRKR